MSPRDGEESSTGVSRVEAFSDGVIAIIVTIMVLELHPPMADGIDQLWALWPVFLAYVLSYAFVAIYWVNHHRLFSHATAMSNGLMWSNILLLFTLSLIPFTTGYLGEQHFGRQATWLYLVSTLLPAIAYTWLQAVIRRTGKQDEATQRYHRRTVRKGLAATCLYLTGIVLTLVSPWLGIACAAVVAVLWFLPDSPLDALFEGRGGHRRSLGANREL